MAITSITSFNVSPTNKLKKTTQNQNASNVSFGVAPNTAHVAPRKTLGLVAAALAALGAMVSTVGCDSASAVGPNEPPSKTDTTATINPPKQDTISPVQEKLKEMVEFLGLKQAQSTIALARVAYLPNPGDITQINYTVAPKVSAGTAYELTYDQDSSSKDTTVFSYIERNTATGYTTKGTKTFTTTANGIKESDKNVENELPQEYEYVANEAEGYVVKYRLNSDGTKAISRKIYPGQVANSLRETYADGSWPVDIANINIVYQ